MASPRSARAHVGRRASSCWPSATAGPQKPARVAPALFAGGRYVANPWHRPPHARRAGRVGVADRNRPDHGRRRPLARRTTAAGPRMLAVSRSRPGAAGHRPDQPRPCPHDFQLPAGHSDLDPAARPSSPSSPGSAPHGGDATDVVDSLRPVTQHDLGPARPRGAQLVPRTTCAATGRYNRHRMAPAVVGTARRACAQAGRCGSRGRRCSRWSRDGSGVVANLQRGGLSEQAALRPGRSTAPAPRTTSAALAPSRCARCWPPAPPCAGSARARLRGRPRRRGPRSRWGRRAPGIHTIGPLRKGSPLGVDGGAGDPPSGGGPGAAAAETAAGRAARRRVELALAARLTGLGRGLPEIVDLGRVAVLALREIAQISTGSSPRLRWSAPCPARPGPASPATARGRHRRSASSACRG